VIFAPTADDVLSEYGLRQTDLAADKVLSGNNLPFTDAINVGDQTFD
jgi:hypothetical protein